MRARAASPHQRVSPLLSRAAPAFARVLHDRRSVAIDRGCRRVHRPRVGRRVHCHHLRASARRHAAGRRPMPAVVVVRLSLADLCLPSGMHLCVSREAQPRLSACLPVNGEREATFAAPGEASARGSELVFCPDSRGVRPGMRVVGGACLSSLRHERGPESIEVLRMFAPRG